MLISGKSLAFVLGGLLVAATAAVLYLPSRGQAEESATEITVSTAENSEKREDEQSAESTPADAPDADGQAKSESADSADDVEPSYRVQVEGIPVGDEDVQAVRMAGYSDEQIVEIVQHVALNTWTNYINEVARTEVDFPVVAPRKAA